MSRCDWKRSSKYYWVKTKRVHRRWDSALVALCYTLLFIFFVAIPLSYLVVIGNAKQYPTKPDYHEPAETYSIELDVLTGICGESELPPEIKNEYCDRAYEYVKNKATFSDLAAQQIMASATTGLLWASWVALIAGFFTVGLLVVTFSVTRSMLHEANRTAAAAEEALKESRSATAAANRTADAAEAAEAPYLDIKITAENIDGTIDINFVITNHGKTPAIGVFRNHHLFFMSMRHAREGWGEFDDAGVIAAGRSSETIYPETDFTIRNMIDSDPDDLDIMLGVEVSYKTVFDNKTVLTTQKVVSIYPDEIDDKTTESNLKLLTMDSGWSFSDLQEYAGTYRI